MKHCDMKRFETSLRGTLLLLIIIFFLFQPAEVQPVDAAAASACPAGRKCIFLPSLLTPAASGDLVLTGFEVTQAIQDDRNSVPLVAGRTTILRVYAQTVGSAQPLSNVKVQISASRSGLLVGGMLQANSMTLPLTVSRSNYGSTINVPLPDAWLSGEVDLTVRLDPDNAIAEANEKNNTLTQRLVFNNVPALQIKIVPILYKHTPNGRTYPAPKEDTISDWIRRIYPVSKVEVSWHAPYAFTGDLSTGAEFSRLLNEVTSLKSSEGAPASQVYYGLVPVSDGNSSWFHGGIAGIGWMGLRTSIGLNTNNSAAQIAAHEIGHNLGMPHTPCGSAAGADQNYPYKDGSIGQFGLDLVSGTLYSPAEAKDIMSYCNPKWVSDYTYKTFFQSQVKSDTKVEAFMEPALAVSGARRTLLVRANLTDEGAELLPSYVLPGQAFGEAAQSAEYHLQIFGAQDELLADVPVQVLEKELEAEEMQGIHALVPMPDAPAARLRLMKAEQILAEQDLRVITMDRLQGFEVTPNADKTGYTVRWGAVDRLALVRYTADGGKTWTTLGVDQAGGEMFVDAALLPAEGGEFDVVLADTWK